MTRKALMARRTQSDREGAAYDEASNGYEGASRSATRALADLDGAECEEDAELLRGCRMTREALMMRRTQCAGEGTR